MSRKQQRKEGKLNKGKNNLAQVRLSFDDHLSREEKKDIRLLDGLFNERGRNLAITGGRLQEYLDNRKRYRKISRRLNRANRKGHRGRASKQYSRLAGLSTTEQAARTDVIDDQRFRRTAQLQAQYLEVLGESQRLQQEQATVLEQSIRERDRVFQAGVEEQTSLQREILAEQQEQQRLAALRQQRAEVRTQEQNRLQGITVAQQGLLTRGRRASAIERRRTAPAVSITARYF